MELILRTNDLGEGKINVGFGNFRINSLDQIANSILVSGVLAIQELVFDWNSGNDHIDDSFIVDLYDNFEDTNVNMYFSNLFVGGNLGFGFSGQTKIELSEGCSLNAEFRAHIDKDVLHIKIFDATFDGQVFLQVDDWRAGVKVEGIGVNYHDDLQVTFPRAAFVFLEFGEGANFSGGKPIAIGDYDFLKRQQPGWNAPPGMRSPLHERDTASITFNDATLNFSGSAHLDINKVDAPVTIEGCTISQSGGGVAVSVNDCSAAVTVSGNNFTGAGLVLIECTSANTIADNQMNVTNGGAVAIGLGISGQTSVTGNTVTCGSGAGYALTSGDMTGNTTITQNTFNASQATGCMFLGTGTVYADDNVTLSGNIYIVQGPVHIEGNTMQCNSFIDAWPEGGLMNDPVEDNDGLDPFVCFTFVDFDGNGCCEYPPPANEQDDDGNCGCDGVSPAGGK